MSKHPYIPIGHAIESVPQMTASMEYHVPFEWGELVVTSEANQAYDLTPLTNTLPGGPSFDELDPYAKGRKSAIVFILAGPGENSTRIQDGYWSTAAVAGKLSIYASGFTHTKKDIIDNNTQKTTSVLESIFGSPDLEESDITKRITFGDGLSIDQVMEQSAAMLLVHSLATLATESVLSGETERFTTNVNQRFLHRIRTLGLLGTINIPLGIMAGSLLHNPILTSLVPSIATALVMGNIMKAIEQHIQMDKSTRNLAVQSAEYTARQVASDIHQTYCRQHFDRTLERLVFESPNDEN